MNEKLAKIVELMPVIHDIAGEEMIITVYDTEGYILGYALPKDMTPMLKVGDKFEDPSGSFDRVIRTGEKIHNILPAEVMGEPFEGDVVPIKDGKEVVGVIVSSYSALKKQNILDTVDKFAECVDKIRASMDAVSSGMANVSTELAVANDMTGTIREDVSASMNIVGKVRSNASNSNILALNASIEAARSGEAGRGFAVVATEMGHLAKDSGSAAEEIKNSLNVMQEHINSTLDSIKVANDGASEYLDMVKGVLPVLEEITKLSEIIENNIN